MEVSFRSAGNTLRGTLVGPTSGTRGSRRALVLVHGFPSSAGGAAGAAASYPALAERIAADGAWTCLTFNLSGTGASDGDFSLGGWLDDLRAAVDFMYDDVGVDGVWLVGFDSGGALAICEAGEDDRVQGVASIGAPADFHDWASDARRHVERCRQLGVITSVGFPQEFDKWARELREIRAVAVVGKVPPRPLLLLHGSLDEVVSLTDARVLADAAEGQCELRVISAGGHRLRHDPRAMAVLLGWLDRQQL